MPVIDVTKDPSACSMTVTSEYDAPVERCWQLWSDPRQLERWWGPPNFPASVTQHNLAPGGRVEYGMIGPQGDRHRRYWEILEAEPPHRLVFVDGVANPDGTPNADMQLATTRVALEQVNEGRTRMSIESRFPSAEAMEWILATGTDVGRTLAVGQMDAILAEQTIKR